MRPRLGASARDHAAWPAGPQAAVLRGSACPALEASLLPVTCMKDVDRPCCRTALEREQDDQRVSKQADRAFPTRTKTFRDGCRARPCAILRPGGPSSRADPHAAVTACRCSRPGSAARSGCRAFAEGPRGARGSFSNPAIPRSGERPPTKCSLPSLCPVRDLVISKF